MSEVSFTQGDGLPKVVLAGPLTIAEVTDTRANLLTCLQGMAEDAKAQPLRVDLSEVTDFDSAGAQLLVSTSRWARQRGQVPLVDGLSPAVLQVAHALGALAAEQCCGFARSCQSASQGA